MNQILTEKQQDRIYNLANKIIETFSKQGSDNDGVIASIEDILRWRSAAILPSMSRKLFSDDVPFGYNSTDANVTAVLVYAIALVYAIDSSINSGLDFMEKEFNIQSTTKPRF